MNWSVAFWIVSSIFFSTAIITVNKSLTRVYNFHWMTTLTSFHFLFTYILLEIMCRLNLFERANGFPMTRRWLLAAWGVGSVVFMNYNLQKNSVGFYQLSKLCTIPALVVFKYFYEKQTTPTNILFSLTILLIGVFLYSVNDVEYNTQGCIIAIIAVVATCGFQWKSAQEQKTYNIKGTQCQHATALPQFVLALCSSFGSEFYGENSILNHHFEKKELLIILITALLSVGVNVSFFILIGKTSPITYQVVGHLKTVLILVSGFIMFPPPPDADKSRLNKTILGVLVSLCGIFLYSYFSNTNKKPITPPEEETFLKKENSETDMKQQTV